MTPYTYLFNKPVLIFQGYIKTNEKCLLVYDYLLSLLTLLLYNQEKRNYLPSSKECEQECIPHGWRTIISLICLYSQKYFSETYAPRYISL